MTRLGQYFLWVVWWLELRSWGAIRPLSVNPTSRRRLSHTPTCANAHTHAHPHTHKATISCHTHVKKQLWLWAYVYKTHLVCGERCHPLPLTTLSLPHTHKVGWKNVTGDGRKVLEIWLDRPRCQKSYRSSPVTWLLQSVLFFPPNLSKIWQNE